MEKKRLLVIRSSKDSAWGSCKVISPNLLALYKGLSPLENEVDYFDLPEKFSKVEIESGEELISELAKKIKSFKPTSLVFVDHVPTPPKILGYLLYYLNMDELPPIVFHIYGDFTFFVNEWKHLGVKLKNHPVKFIVASESQKRLLSFFSHSDAAIETFLFPVNEKNYFYDALERKSARQEFKVEDNEKIILYSGRVSQQKNVDILVQEFSHICEISDNRTQLWITGSFDDVGANFMGIKNFQGYYFAKMQLILESLPAEHVKKIRFFDHQSKEQLRKIKNAADMFISLRLYHDEDYGMSPAEALSCGLPSLLTDWGGYSSFASDKWGCSLMPVEITTFGHKLNLSALYDFVQNNLKDDDIMIRLKRSQSFLKEFSIESNIGRLNTILAKDSHLFQGFKWNLGYFSNEYWSVNPGHELSKQLNPSSDNFYYEVYSNYISANFSEKTK